jgi:hypothetical protein
MHTRVSENGGLGGAAKRVSDHASTIVRLELELAALEVKHKLASLTVGIGLGLGAAVLGVFAAAFAFATIAAVLATFLDTWLALLIVTAFLAVLAGLLGLLAVGAIKKGTPPLPEQAIREAKLTTSAIKS